MEELKKQVTRVLSTPAVGVGSPFMGAFIANIDHINKILQSVSLTIGCLVGIASFIYYVIKIKGK